MQCKQMLAKKHNAIAFANLTMALDTPCLIARLLQSQTLLWPQGLANSGELVV